APSHGVDGGDGERGGAGAGPLRQHGLLAAPPLPVHHALPGRGLRPRRDPRVAAGAGTPRVEGAPGSVHRGPRGGERRRRAARRPSLRHGGHRAGRRVPGPGAARPARGRGRRSGAPDDALLPRLPVRALRGARGGRALGQGAPAGPRKWISTRLVPETTAAVANPTRNGRSPVRLMADRRVLRPTPARATSTSSFDALRASSERSRPVAAESA